MRRGEVSPPAFVGPALLLTSLMLVNPAWAELKGYDDNLSDSIPAVLIDIDPVTGNGTVPLEFADCLAAPNPPNTVFGAGFTTGCSFISDTLYCVEFDPVSGTDIYLYTVADSFCAEGTRVGSAPVGFRDLESLAYCPSDGFLYSVDFDFALPHLGQLIRIDPATGIGTAIGDHMAPDVWVIGLACDSSGQLYGITNGFADRNIQELYAIDRNTGVETLIGPTSTDPQELQSLALDSSVFPPRLVAAGTLLYEIESDTAAATVAGTATLIGGNYNGTVWALADRPTGAPPTPTPTTPVVATPTPTTPAGECCGDCNEDGSVTVNEVITGVNIALGGASVDQCPQFDANIDGAVGINELVKGINALLFGCGVLLAAPLSR